MARFKYNHESIIAEHKLYAAAGMSNKSIAKKLMMPYRSLMQILSIQETKDISEMKKGVIEKREQRFFDDKKYNQMLGYE